LDQKKFYNRETIAALNYKMQQMSLISHPLYAAKIIFPFLNSRISAKHDKVDELSANGEILLKGIISLLYNLLDLLHAIP
jgi:hypothetical protein